MRIPCCALDDYVYHPYGLSFVRNIFRIGRGLEGIVHWSSAVGATRVQRTPFACRPSCVGCDPTMWAQNTNKFNGQAFPKVESGCADHHAGCAMETFAEDSARY